MEGPWVFLFLLGAFSLQNVMIQPAQGSTKNDGCGLNKRVEDLEIKLERLELLEIEVEKLKETLLVQSLDLTINQKEDLVTIEKSWDINDDVDKNTEDILSIKQEMFHHHEIVFQVQKDTELLNVTLHKDVEMIDDEIDEFKTEYNDNNIYIEQTRPPLGSVIAWLPEFSQTKEIPQGWQRCDGSTIMKGPFTGEVTPDLNKANRYLRGGDDSYSSQIQEDAVQDHTHLDEGHTHQDAGHTHTDAGHEHGFADQSPYKDMFGHGSESDHSGSYLIEVSDSGYYHYKLVERTDSSAASISTNNANIQTSKSGMSGIENGRMADETRPKSMFAVFIMRIF